MPDLSPRTIALLERFAAAPDREIAVADLHAAYSDREELDWRLDVLKKEGLIAIHHVRSESGDGWIRLGVPVSWRMTPAGADFLSMRQQRLQQLHDDEARRETDRERDRMQAETAAARNRRNVLVSALLGAAFGALLTFAPANLHAILAFLRGLFG